MTDYWGSHAEGRDARTSAVIRRPVSLAGARRWRAGAAALRPDVLPPRLPPRRLRDRRRLRQGRTSAGLRRARSQEERLPVVEHLERLPGEQVVAGVVGA